MKYGEIQGEFMRGGACGRYVRELTERVVFSDILLYT